MTNEILISKAMQIKILFSKPRKKVVCIPASKLHSVYFNSAVFTGKSLEKINLFLAAQKT